MLNLKSISIATLLFGFTATQALADSRYDYAKVVKVNPVYQYTSVKQPVQQCYPVKRTVRYNNNNHQRVHSTVAGAVIGGVIGNVIGDNRSSTIAGAVIGGAIGNHAQGPQYSTSVTQHCETVYQTSKKVRKIKGYDVKYRYRGAAYETFMRSHPGDTVKVRVTVSPKRH
ncbi:glycine zipper 2TM domain-containing protein [Aliiglaciecola sp. 3_MG-2023]|uniref:glycine zipper 2TM domain-containing protein n=1 Tax=Aliiglaciecola sp. 3_MG-2023 TaxID=3062644 RepID=UPI0026E2D4EB|nr:glycine zipper 2TM domain-containing protein [Aliiglaciecola sp. 3_MG-2023]MDO6693506.1 glycine zipper 2TM domain-containing protein [Aliiglaciecola sp. 3_MG-2023]